MKIFNILLVGAIMAVLLVCPVWADGPDGVLNAAYRIDNQTVRLINGRAEREAAPGSAAKIITGAAGNPVYGDLDGDGQADAALFLYRQTGGSGSFYYVAAAQFVNGRWQGTNAVFVGDRVAPKTIDISDGVIIARYLDRRPEESLTEAPSIVKTLELELVGGYLDVLQP
jgi:hypothetical protein